MSDKLDIIRKRALAMGFKYDAGNGWEHLLESKDFQIKICAETGLITLFERCATCKGYIYTYSEYLTYIDLDHLFTLVMPKPVEPTLAEKYYAAVKDMAGGLIDPDSPNAPDEQYGYQAALRDVLSSLDDIREEHVVK